MTQVVIIMMIHFKSLYNNIVKQTCNDDAKDETG